VLPEAAHDLERPLVGEPQARPQQASAARERLVAAGSAPEKSIGMRSSRFGSARAPRRGAGDSGSATPGKALVELEQVEDQLEVQVRRPVAVAGRRADVPDRLSPGDGLADLEAGEGLLGEVAVEREERRAVGPRHGAGSPTVP
jgi:hypothetical protein